MSRIASFLRDQPVLSISALLAALSCVFVRRGLAAWAASIDVRVICLLFCMMLAVSGIRRAGAFEKIVEALLRGSRTPRFVAGVLTTLAFFASMLVTNDVALITLVPFCLFALAAANRLELAAPIVVLLTVAANMGSAATPFGNPQNLFIFAYYGLDLGSFVATLLPYTVLSGVLLAACVLFMRSRDVLELPQAHDGDEARLDVRACAVYAALFVVAVAAVLQVVPYPAALVVCVAVPLAMRDARVLASVDYALLATFACFFIFTGNIANVPEIAAALTQAMEASPFSVSLLASQCISNVPAAALLAPFTNDWAQLLVGVDVGGLGTPIASLASLISLEFYRKEKAGGLGAYLRLFLVANVGFLAANCLLWALL